MSLKPPKKSDLGKSWMKPRRDKNILIRPEYYLIVTEGMEKYALLFYHLIHFQDNIVCYFPFWKEDFVKKLQSCAGKADMFVERSRNKSIDKKSVLCYSEGTNYIQSIWTSRFSRGKNTS